MSRNSKAYDQEFKENVIKLLLEAAVIMQVMKLKKSPN